MAHQDFVLENVNFIKSNITHIDDFQHKTIKKKYLTNIMFLSIIKIINLSIMFFVQINIYTSNMEKYIT